MTISLEVKKVENLTRKDRDLVRRVEFMKMNLKKKGEKKYFITIAQVALEKEKRAPRGFVLMPECEILPGSPPYFQ